MKLKSSGVNVVDPCSYLSLVSGCSFKRRPEIRVVVVIFIDSVKRRVLAVIQQILVAMKEVAENKEPQEIEVKEEVQE